MGVRHVLRVVRSCAPQVPQVKPIITGAFSQGVHFLGMGQPGPDVPQHTFRSLCRGLSRATPAVVMQALQNSVVPEGTPFSGYLSELWIMVANVRCVGHLTPEDGTMQISIKTTLDDQFAGLSGLIFAGRNMRALPYDSVDELMGASEDLALNKTRATASVRLTGGMMTCSRT